MANSISSVFDMYNSVVNGANSYNAGNTKSANKASSGDIYSTVGNSLNDLAFIKSGTYKKLVSSYYNKYGKEGNSATKAVSSELNNLKTVAGDSSKLKNAAKELSKIDFSDEKSKDDAKAAAKNFVNSYNSLIGSSVEVNRNSVLKGTVGVVNFMKSNAGMLNELGMKLGSDNKITFDEDKWDKAYNTSKSSMFKGVGSFGSQLEYKAGKVASASSAGTGVKNTAATYNANASYNLPNNNLSWLFDSTT